MGIPSFYRWVVERYPRTVVDVIEETPAVVNGVSVPIDTSLPNPNGLEFDNLYLDMNGIIHPCFHPEGLPAPSTYEEVFTAVFKYIDKIFSIVRPRKLLFLAIDGVAPRAKMNQQRSRRFRAAKDAADEAMMTERFQNVFEAEEKQALLEQPKKLDSNVITPGTEFMDLLSLALRYYIHSRMNEDSGWRGIKVILSDASVPGEGEHKIMSYIRLQRNLLGFDPNTRHCLYGLDADLIMLALATHEIHFTILREDLHKNDDIKSWKKHERNKKRKKKKDPKAGVNLEEHILGLSFQFFNIWVLRDYLAYDMRIPGSTLKADLERLIDDFVFICLFVGNDFLPHIPSLEISEGAIDLLMMVYKNEFEHMGGYLTNSSEVNLTRVEHFVQAVGSHECAIFRKRNRLQKQKERKFQFPLQRKVETSTFFQELQNPKGMEIQGSVSSKPNSITTIVDKINLGEEGWKERFYEEKFEVKTHDEREKIRRHLVFKYMEGICWVMRYYYEGVCSWQWFYPYHYAPFASDICGLDQLEIHFTPGEPFKPLDQLMGVLPSASAHALPLFYRRLMTDASSPILDFYPTDFELDMNGKRFSWQAICKLPFIDEARLLSELAKVEHTLTDEERRRNTLGLDILFVHILHPLAVMIVPFYRQNGSPQFPKAEVKQEIDPKLSGGMNGYIYISDKPVRSQEIYSPINGMPIIANNEVISVFYKYPPPHPHMPRLPEGVNLPARSVKKRDILPLPPLGLETAVCGCLHSKRPIPKSISGSCLAQLAHQLVSQCYATKKQDGLGYISPAFRAYANRLQHLQKRKEKKNEGNKNYVGNSKETVEKLETCILNEQRSYGVHEDTNGVEEIKTETKSKKKEKKQQGAGLAPNNVQELESFMGREQRNADGVQALADGEGEGIKTEVELRKRKRRSEKKKSSKVNVAPNDNVGKLEGCPGQASESTVLREQREGGDIHQVAGSVVGMETEPISKKSKRRSKKKRRIEPASEGVQNSNVVKLDSCDNMEMQSLANKNGEKFETVPDNNAGKLNCCNNVIESVHTKNVEKLDEYVNIKKLQTSGFGEKMEGDDIHGSAKGLMEMRTEFNFCNGVPHNHVDKLDSFSVVQRLQSVPNKNVEGLDSSNSDKNLVGSIGEQGKVIDVYAGKDGVVDIEIDVKPKKRGQQSKKKRLIEADSTGEPNNSAQTLDSCNNVEKLEISPHVSVQELHCAKNVESTGNVSDDNVKQLVNSNDFEKFESTILGEQWKGNGVHADANVEKLESTIVGGQRKGNDVNADANFVVDAVTEVQSKKRKRKPKKTGQVEASGVLVGGDVQNLESFPFREQAVRDVEHGTVDGIAEPRSTISHNNAKQLDNINDIEKLESTVVGEQRKCNDVHVDTDVEKLESNIAGLQRKGNDVNADTTVVVDATTEVQSQKRERKPKKKKQVEASGVLNGGDAQNFDTFPFGEGGPNVDRLEEIRSVVTNNNVKQLDNGNNNEKLASTILGEQGKGNDVLAGTNVVVDAKKEVNGVCLGGVQKLESCPFEEQGVRDVEHEALDGIVEPRSTVSVNNVKQLHNGNNIDKLESTILGEQRKDTDVSAAANVVIDANREVQTKKSKRRPKKKKQVEADGVLVGGGVQKLESCPLEEQGGQDVEHGTVDGIVEPRSTVSINNVKQLHNGKNIDKLDSTILREQRKDTDVNAAANVVMDANTEVQSKKGKRRPKKEKQVEADGVLVGGGVQKLESCPHEEQGGRDVEHGTMDGIAESRITVSNVKQLDKVNNIEKLEITVTGEQKIGNDVCAATDVVVDANTEVQSKKRKRRPKKEKQVEADGVLVGGVQKLESCPFEEQGRMGVEHGAVDALKENRTVSNNNVKQLGDGNNIQKLEMTILGEQMKGNDVLAGTNVVVDAKAEVEADGACSGGDQKLESCLFGKQGGQDVEHGTMDGIAEPRSAVSNNNTKHLDQVHNIGKLEGAIIGELKKGNDVHAGTNVVVDANTKVQSKKKKRRHKKNKVESDGVLVGVDVQRLKRCPFEKQGGRDVEHGTTDLEETRSNVPNNTFGPKKVGEGNDCLAMEGVALKPEVKS